MHTYTHILCTYNTQSKGSSRGPREGAKARAKLSPGCASSIGLRVAYRSAGNSIMCENVFRPIWPSDIEERKPEEKTNEKKKL